jgi:hypothetical protein
MYVYMLIHEIMNVSVMYGLLEPKQWSSPDQLGLTW